jgi:hypothetical protein
VAALENFAQHADQDAEHDGGAQGDADVFAAKFEIEITGEPPEAEAAQQGREPTDEEEGEEGDEEPAHGSEAVLLKTIK